MSEIIHGDCLEVMPTLDKVDMVLADLPYGTTACKWDTVIPFEPLWENYKRLIKDNGAIVLFGSEPFSSALRMSNIKNYKYDVIWEKTLFSNFALVKKQPAKLHENISVFYKKQPTYNPQMTEGKPYKDKLRKRTMGVMGDAIGEKKAIDNKGTRYPSSIQKYSNGNNKSVHPTQKPVALFEYLIKTYTNEGETVLDNTAGSMTTAIACINTNRNYICIEKDKDYYEKGCERVEKHKQQLNLEL